MPFCITSELQRENVAFFVINAHCYSVMLLYTSLLYHRFFFPSQEATNTDIKWYTGMAHIQKLWEKKKGGGRGRGEYKQVKELISRKLPSAGISEICNCDKLISEISPYRKRGKWKHSKWGLDYFWISCLR